VEHTLAEVSADPEHPLRARFDQAVQEFAERLRTSPDTIARAEAIKEELLAHPAVREYAGSVWADVKAALARHAGRALPAPAPAALGTAEAEADGAGHVGTERLAAGVSDALADGADRATPEATAGVASDAAPGPDAVPGVPDAPTAVERGLVAVGNTLLADPALTAKVDGWIREAVLFAIDQYRVEAAQFIEVTVAGWDPAATSHRIEVQIGRDLQFIRINGTLVGGLVGLFLYAAGQLVDALR
jgi:uncharacterized membrane-anchored protein YjiN (DUF445 family)